jgi:hypothetical protein
VSEPRKLKIARSAVSTPKVIEAAEPPPKPKAIEADKHPVLAPGDRVEYGVTHEIDVDGEKAWVRYGVNSSVAEGESADQATARLVGFVNAVVMQSATEVAQQIMRG